MPRLLDSPEAMLSFVQSRLGRKSRLDLLTEMFDDAPGI